MKNPECVQKKVKITPPDYSKENYLATFTPQKQLTPEQIFWSQDLIKMKAEALKTQATASRPIKALMVYPPNRPAPLVPRVLLTKSQIEDFLGKVKIPLVRTVHHCPCVPLWHRQVIPKLQAKLQGLSWIFEAFRARGFVLRSQELQILSFIWEIQYPNLID
ncbi:hypothetical protein Tco_0315964 [Tanacetum coccineum]